MLVRQIFSEFSYIKSLMQSGSASGLVQPPEGFFFDIGALSIKTGRLAKYLSEGK